MRFFSTWKATMMNCKFFIRYRFILLFIKITWVVLCFFAFAERQQTSKARLRNRRQSRRFGWIGRLPNKLKLGIWARVSLLANSARSAEAWQAKSCLCNIHTACQCVLGLSVAQFASPFHRMRMQSYILGFHSLMQINVY